MWKLRAGGQEWAADRRTPLSWPPGAGSGHDNPVSERHEKGPPLPERPGTCYRGNHLSQAGRASGLIPGPRSMSAGLRSQISGILLANIRFIHASLFPGKRIFEILRFAQYPGDPASVHSVLRRARCRVSLMLALVPGALVNFCSPARVKVKCGAPMAQIQSISIDPYCRRRSAALSSQSGSRNGETHVFQGASFPSEEEKAEIRGDCFLKCGDFMAFFPPARPANTMPGARA